MPRTEKFCSARNCFNSRGSTEKLTFFLFPKEEIRCQIWQESSGRVDIVSKPPKEICQRQYFLCADHFEDKYFLNVTKKHRLTKDAIPTLFSPVPVGSRLAPFKIEFWNKQEADPQKAVNVAESSNEMKEHESSNKINSPEPSNEIGTAESSDESDIAESIELNVPESRSDSNITAQTSFGEFIFEAESDLWKKAEAEECIEVNITELNNEVNVLESRSNPNNPPRTSFGQPIFESLPSLSEMDPSGTSESCYEIIVESGAELKNPTQSTSGKLVFQSSTGLSEQGCTESADSCYEIIVESSSGLKDPVQSFSGQPMFKSGDDFTEEYSRTRGWNCPARTPSSLSPTFQEPKRTFLSLQPLTIVESAKEPFTDGQGYDKEHCFNSEPTTEKHFLRFYRHVLEQLQASPFKQSRDLSELEILWHFTQVWKVLPSKSRAFVWKRLQLLELVAQYGWEAALPMLPGESIVSVQVDQNLLPQFRSSQTVPNGTNNQQRSDQSIQDTRQPTQLFSGAVPKHDNVHFQLF